MPEMEIEIEDGIVVPDSAIPSSSDDDADYDEVTYVGKGQPIPEDNYDEVEV